MNISIPMDIKNIKETICKSFGRAPYYLIYNIKNHEYEFIDNPAIRSIGGAGVKAAQSIVDSGAKVLLVLRCGINAAEVIRGSGLEIYKAKEVSAIENVNMYINGQLNILEEIHSGFHGTGDLK